MHWIISGYESVGDFLKTFDPSQSQSCIFSVVVQPGPGLPKIFRVQKMQDSRNRNLSRKFVFHQIPSFCGDFIFNSHFLISLLAYKLYCFRYRWSGNCFPESESPETDFPRIRNQNKTGFFTGLISSAVAYPVSKKLSVFWLGTIFNQKFMVFLRWPWSIKNRHLWSGQNISVLVLSLNIYRFLFISIKYFFIKLYFFIILSQGQVLRGLDRGPGKFVENSGLSWTYNQSRSSKPESSDWRFLDRGTHGLEQADHGLQQGRTIFRSPMSTRSPGPGRNTFKATSVWQLLWIVTVSQVSL